MGPPMAWEQCCCSRPLQNGTTLGSKILLAPNLMNSESWILSPSAKNKARKGVHLHGSIRSRQFGAKTTVSCSSSKFTPPESPKEQIDSDVPSQNTNHSYNDRDRNWERLAVTGMLALAVIGGAQDSVAQGWFGGPSYQKDPVEPFTIYGSVFKKFLIEDIIDGKVVGRRKGFTATACVNCLEASRETPEMQAVPSGLKVSTIGEPSCSKGVGKTKEESCETPCGTACREAVRRHARLEAATTGYRLESTDEARAVASCSSQCYFECMKAGKSISFVVPFRP